MRATASAALRETSAASSRSTREPPETRVPPRVSRATLCVIGADVCGEKEVFFPQQHVAGREGAIDFTHGTELGVTVAGELFVHLLFQ